MAVAVAAVIGMRSTWLQTGYLDGVQAKLGSRLTMPGWLQGEMQKREAV